MKFQLEIAGTGLLHLKGDHAISVRFMACLSVHHINIRVLQTKQQAFALKDVAIERLAGLHSNLKVVLGAEGLHRIALMAFGIIQRIQLLDIAHQLLGVILGGEVVKRALEHTFFGDIASFHQANDTVTVNKHRLGVGIHAQRPQPSLIAGGHGESQTIACLKQCNVAIRIAYIGVHRDDLQLIAVQIVCLLHIREFRLTGRATGVPEVQHHRVLGLEDLGNGQHIAIGIHNGKIADHIAQLIHPVGGIGALDHRRRQDDIGVQFRQRVVFLQVVAFRNAFQLHHIGIAAGCGEGDHAIGRYRAVSLNVGAIAVGVDIVVHILEDHTTSCFHADGIDGLHGLGGLGRGAFGIVICTTG